MSETPEPPKPALRSRRRTDDDDDAEADAAPEPPKPPKAALAGRRRTDDDDAEADGAAEAEGQPAAGRRRAPRAERTAAPPAAGRHADPIGLGPGSPLAPLAAPAAPAPAAPASQAVDVFEVAYDTLSVEKFYAMLESLTRQEVEKRIVENEQMWRKQQQAPQVERFLDAGVRQGAGTSGSSAGEAIGYRYNDMLQRLFMALDRNKESSAMSERNKLPVPQLEKIGKKKVIITNFGRICQAFQRPIEDVKDYIENELSVGGNLDSNDALILKYEIQKATAFDKILIRYLDEFVKCNSCHKIDTRLTKEGRRTELRCNWCTATRSVQAVGSATYRAQVGKRSKARLQALTL